MNISLLLTWHKPGLSVVSGFKQTANGTLFLEYLGRIKKYSSAEAIAALPKKSPTTGGRVLWLCHTSPKARQISTEDLASFLDDYLISGVREWVIGIGGPDGFTDADIASYKPDFIWRFGPLTYPHELAAVVAAEQIYRAWTILKKHPYHLGH